MQSAISTFAIPPGKIPWLDNKIITIRGKHQKAIVFKIFVCEPFKKNLDVYKKDISYKKKLKENELFFITKALGAKKEKRNINIYSEDNNSTFYKPDGKDLDLFCQMQTDNIKSSKLYKKQRFTIKKKVKVKTVITYNRI